MMNSTNDLKNHLIKQYAFTHFEEPTHQQLIFDVPNHQMLDVLAHLKSIGFGQLSMLTCVDWIELNHFQLIYILLDWESGIHVIARTLIDRDYPVYRTANHIYPGIQYYERDVHEFYGVEFEGNEDSYKHLFLELWTAAPPLRKDFDPEKFSNERFTMREYKKTFNNKEEDKDDSR